jgi:hypothetical protein
MRPSCLLFSDGHGIGEIVAVQDTFGGRTFRCCRQRHYPGEVIHERLNATPGWATRKDGLADTNFRIAEPVHINVVRAFLKSIGRNDSLHAGYWYRVIED